MSIGLNHFKVSLVKSIARIFSGLFLTQGMLLESGACLVVAELLGILEEFVDRRKE